MLVLKPLELSVALLARISSYLPLLHPGSQIATPSRIANTHFNLVSPNYYYSIKLSTYKIFGIHQ